MKTQALYLTGDVDRVWPLLQEVNSFDDNGGEPAGNAWLSTTYDQGDAERIIAAGLGELIDARTATIETMAAYCGIRVLDMEFYGLEGGVIGVSDALREMNSHQRNDFLQDVLFPQVEDRTACWAFFSSNDEFIFVER